MLYQFVKFSLVGIVSALINIGVVNFLVFFTGVVRGFDFTIFAIVGFLISVFNSYLLNKFWTFNSGTAVSPQESFLFFVFAGIGGAIYVGVLSFLVNIVGAPLTIAPKAWINISIIIAIMFSFFWNFFSYKHIVFKKRVL